jgi:hypothetical protein
MFALERLEGRKLMTAAFLGSSQVPYTSDSTTAFVDNDSPAAGMMSYTPGYGYSAQVSSDPGDTGNDSPLPHNPRIPRLTRPRSAVSWFPRPRRPRPRSRRPLRSRSPTSMSAPGILCG